MPTQDLSLRPALYWPYVGVVSLRRGIQRWRARFERSRVRRHRADGENRVTRQRPQRRQRLNTTERAGARWITPSPGASRASRDHQRPGERWNALCRVCPTGNITQTFEWADLGDPLGATRCAWAHSWTASWSARCCHRRAGAAAAPPLPLRPARSRHSRSDLTRACRAAAPAPSGGAQTWRLHAQGRAKCARWRSDLARRAAHARLPAQSLRHAPSPLLGARYPPRRRARLLAGMKEKWRYNIRLAGRKACRCARDDARGRGDLLPALRGDRQARRHLHPRQAAL